MEATDGSGNVQRQFARKIISTPANEIRKSATAAMKAAKEVYILMLAVFFFARTRTSLCAKRLDNYLQPPFSYPWALANTLLPSSPLKASHTKG